MYTVVNCTLLLFDLNLHCMSATGHGLCTPFDQTPSCFVDGGSHFERLYTHHMCDVFGEPRTNLGNGDKITDSSWLVNQSSILLTVAPRCVS